MLPRFIYLYLCRLFSTYGGGHPLDCIWCGGSNSCNDDDKCIELLNFDSLTTVCVSYYLISDCVLYFAVFNYCVCFAVQAIDVFKDYRRRIHCQICDEGFETPWALQDHCREVHYAVMSLGIQCPRCLAFVESVADLNFHYSRKDERQCPFPPGEAQLNVTELSHRFASDRRRAHIGKFLFLLK